MDTAGPDLYERLQIHYPPSPSRVPAPGSPPATSRWTLGTILAIGMGVGLVAALATLITLYVQGQAELQAARAELVAIRAHPLPDPNGPWSPGESPAAEQRQKEQLGQWLQGLSLGWRYHQGKIYYLSAEGKTWSDAEAACRFTHSHLASITSSEEQEYLAREARGGSYWIGLTATGPRGSWHWVDGTAYSQAQSFWAPGQPDNKDHGYWGQESCAQIHPVRNGLWNDHNCNFTFPWICKRDLSMP
ncbi:c-type lectin domain family 4 member f-like [Limosa lapponica baueri]|uniref:C-type lectin domain family 4 member f-like n=1 Tax=Limosa lapponica baueri TaxID=1758121 RepID=A0A2I0UL84_LIMLA|nr:c-type lectin domain family 4 member f-like [Limosa lapponica baueri]